MILTGTLIGVFYITVFFRKLFIKDFTPNALKHADADEADTIGTANAQMNAIQASLEKPEAQRG
jgi:hypothetical protein